MIYVPDIIKGRTGYLVMVDRFCRVGEPPKPMEGRKIKEWSDSIPDWQPDADGVYRNKYFYGGNLKGVESKIDYFDKLGVDFVCLSPISRSNNYHHYDVHDQRIIDPYIGDWNDFSLLAKKLHMKKKLLGVDLVFNHRSSESEFFKKAMAGDPKYKKWFEWDENGNPICWSGYKDMPQCNKLEPSYQEFCCEEIRIYIENGADFIRLDLGENFPKEFLMKIKSAARKINPKVVIAVEMWEFAFKKGNPIIYDGQADTVMNYPLADAILRWVRYGNYLHFNACTESLAKYPLQVRDATLNYLSTHDTPRERNMLAGGKMVEDPFSKRFIWDMEYWWDEKGKPFPTYEFRKWGIGHSNVLSPLVDDLQKLASLIQYLSKGIPVIYYGSERGMSGNKDPDSRRPVQWETTNADMFNYYCGLGKMRKENRDILAKGEEYKNTTPNVLEIVRRSENGIILGFINRSSDYQPIEAYFPNAKEIFNLKGSNQSMLAPYGAYVCRF